MRGTNSKNKEKRPKNHSFVAIKGWNRVEKLRPQKAHLGLLLNIHNEFQPTTCIWRGVAWNKLKK